MKARSIAGFLVMAVFLLGGVGTTWACKGAGPNKHIGGVAAIDAKAGTFTIRDAETDRLITFEATELMLSEIQVRDRVMVSYKEDSGRFIAVDVHS